MAKATRVFSTPRFRTSSPDPIIELIKEALKLLAEMKTAREARGAIVDKVGMKNIDRAPIVGGLVFHQLFTQYTFDYIGEFDKACRRKEKELKGFLKAERAALRGRHLGADRQMYARRNILDAQAQLAQLPIVKAWGESEWRREDKRHTAVRRASGYDKALRRYNKAYFAASEAVHKVLTAKPKTAEGNLALVNFVADHAEKNENQIMSLRDINEQIRAPLYRAHKMLRVASLAR
jgi:hypothetical protein